MLDSRTHDPDAMQHILSVVRSSRRWSTMRSSISGGKVQDMVVETRTIRCQIGPHKSNLFQDRTLLAGRPFTKRPDDWNLQGSETRTILPTCEQPSWSRWDVVCEDHHLGVEVLSPLSFHPANCPTRDAIPKSHNIYTYILSTAHHLKALHYTHSPSEPLLTFTPGIYLHNQASYTPFAVQTQT